MPTFNYTAVDGNGKQFSDAMTAENLTALENALQNHGAWLIRAKTAKPSGTTTRSSKAKQDTSIKRWDLINLYTQLSLLLSAGVTLSQALAKLGDDLASTKLGPVVQTLAFHVEAGTSLPKAMSAFPKAFSKQTVALIEAGEASGKLPESFTRLAANLEWVDGLLATARQALIYPIMISSAAVGLVVLLFTFVVPRFQGIFEQFGTDLPAITVAVLSISEFFANYWYVWLTIALSFASFLVLSKRIQAIAVLRDKTMLSLPFLGNLAQSLAISQFSTTMEMLIRSGIPLSNALELCSRQSSNSLIAMASRSAQSAVNEGKPMSEELSKHAVFTQTFITMVQTGEKSGQLDTTLGKVGAYYNMVVPRGIKAFFSFFEPTIIISLIVVVGTVALALILPIMSIWEI